MLHPIRSFQRHYLLSCAGASLLLGLAIAVEAVVLDLDGDRFALSASLLVSGCVAWALHDHVHDHGEKNEK